MNSLQELQLLEIMCNYFQEQTKDSVRQIIFSSLFSPQGNKADDSRMSLLGKLVSMAVAVCRIPVLECAASWLQVLLLQVSEDVSDRILNLVWASLITQLVKNPPAMQETRVRSLGWEDPLEKGKTTHSSILAWRIPGTVQSMGSQRVPRD